jgi:hypothetical protein
MHGISPFCAGFYPLSPHQTGTGPVLLRDREKNKEMRNNLAK